jgi:hypothetical protein
MIQWHVVKELTGSVSNVAHTVVLLMYKKTLMDRSPRDVGASISVAGDWLGLGGDGDASQQYLESNCLAELIKKYLNVFIEDEFSYRSFSARHLTNFTVVVICIDSKGIYNL